jgi:predicted solute-binding protein
MAQDLVAKKCEIIDNEEELDQMTLKHYLNMYNMPLFEQSMKAVLELTEVAVDKGHKKRKD